jgi:hypothetical protein
MAFWYDDKERCAFGLGWEYRRRDSPLKDNPFSMRTDRYRWKQFREGWYAYKPSKTALYHDETIVKYF